MMTDDFDGGTQPMRAIRDLINACEMVFGSDCGEDVILRRAQDGFTALRKLFGDFRFPEDIADSVMIEPDGSRLRNALETAAGALQCVARNLPQGEGTVIVFNGHWLHLAPRTISTILNDANTALERSKAAEG